MVSWDKLNPCGYQNTKDCQHEACMDPLRKFALGTKSKLFHQLGLNSTGEYTETFPVNYTVDDGKIKIIRERYEKRFTPKIRNVNWRKMKVLISIEENNKVLYKTSHSVYVHKRIFPGVKELFPLLMLFLQNLILQKKISKRSKKNH